MNSPFYRVTAKALIFDAKQRLLLVKNHDNHWEIPGGGWEHDEPYEACLGREIREELGVGVHFVGPVVLMYRGTNKRHGFHTLRIAAFVELKSTDFVLGDGMEAYKFVAREEFMALDLLRAEGDVQSHAGKIWPES